MHEPIDVDGIIALGSEATMFARMHSQLDQIKAQPLRPESSERNFYYKEDFTGVKLGGWEDVYLLLSHEGEPFTGEPMVALRTGLFTRAFQVRSLEWHAETKASGYEAVIAYVAVNNYTAPRVNIALNSLAQNLSALLPEGHPLKRRYVQSFF